MNITYYLGAGASANALPVVATMNDRMQYFLNALNEWAIANKIGIDMYSDMYSPVQKRYQELLDQIKGHASIDTFAKKLHIRKDKRNLYVLKAFLSSYLIFEQLDKVEKEGLEHVGLEDISDVTRTDEQKEQLISKLNTKLDYRYDSFFATLLSAENKKLNNKVNIISWNYDSQIEMAYSDFVGKQPYDVRKDLNVFPNHMNDWTRNPLESEIVKLNGTAGLHHRLEGEKEIIDLTTQGMSALQYIKGLIDFSSHIITSIAPFDQFNFPFVNFAWEANETNFQEKGISMAKSIITATDILVIIGYSFPNFNRDIDKQILRNNNFQKVYIQSPKNDLEDYKQRLLGTLGQDFPESIIALNSDLRQFLIPYEL